MNARLALVLGLAALAGCARNRGSYEPLEKPVGVDRYISGMNALRAGDKSRAESDLNAALATNPNLRMAHIQLAGLYKDQGKIDQSLPHWKAATLLDPYEVSNHYNFGLALQLLSRLQEAARAYIAGLEVSPRDFGSNMNLGLCYYALGQLDPATTYLERATQIDPNSAKAWSNLGVVLDSKGSPVLAEASYRRAIELDSDNETNKLNLASNLITQKKPEAALGILKEMQGPAASMVARKRYADALALGKQYGPAAAAYDEILQADPRNTAVWNAKAELFITRYNDGLNLDDALRQQALTFWRQSLTLNANQPAVQQSIDTWTKNRILK